MPSVSRPALLDGSFHHHLLRDEVRLDGYARAIAALVREGDAVADLGAGSGILSWLAARAGARRVHAIEMNTNSYAALLRAVQRNGVAGRVVPVLGDATQWRPSEPVDVVICELMETGLLHESIAAIARNVASWKHAPRAMMPASVELQVEGVALRDEFHGYKVAFSGWRSDEGDPPLTDRATYARYELPRAPPGERVEAGFALRALRGGSVGGIQLRTTSTLAPGVALGDSAAYCTPIVLALDEPLRVAEGERLAGRIAYDFDYTAQPISFELERA